MAIKEDEIQSLKTFFAKKRPLPNNIKLDAGTTILDTEKFLESHFMVLEHNRAQAFSAFYDRLLKLKKVLSQQE